MLYKFIQVLHQLTALLDGAVRLAGKERTFWEISLHIFEISVGSATSQVLKSQKMIEGAHLVLNPVLLVNKGSPQQGFPLLVGLLRSITLLHRYCLSKKECTRSPPVDREVLKSIIPC